MKNLKKLTLNSETVRVLTDSEASQIQGGKPISWLNPVKTGCICPAPTIGCPDTVTECICP